MPAERYPHLEEDSLNSPGRSGAELFDAPAVDRSPMKGESTTESTIVLEDFDQGWLAELEQSRPATLVTALGGLTRLGEHPALLGQLATILGCRVEETVALLRGNTTARIEDGLIHWDDPFPGDRTLRTLYVVTARSP